MEIEKKTLYLFKQLYEMSMPKEGDNINSLKEKTKYFDINPHLNYEIMKKMLKGQNESKISEENAKIFFDFYMNYIQTLTFEQKKEIINEIKSDRCIYIQQLFEDTIKLNEDSFIESYFSLLKIIYEKAEQSRNSSIESINPEEIKKLFTIFYYVDNYDINSPIIYGTYELVFASLIYNLYNQLYSKNQKEILVRDNQDSIKGYEKYPQLIIEKIYDDNKDKNKILQEEIMDNNNQINFDSKIDFIISYLKIIISSEFKEIFDLEKIKKENSYIFKPKVNPLIFHLLYFDLIFYIYSLYEKDPFIKKFDENFFFEIKSKKIIFFQKIPKDEFIIVDEQGKEIKNKEDIKNKFYKIINKKNENQSIEFNPYNYILSNISSMKNYNQLLQQLSKPENFSLYKFFQENKLFNNDNLFINYKENIKEMLSLETMKDLFEQYINFNDYIYPYSGEEKENFISQTFEIIYYFPIPFKNIAAYTFKNFGLIYINNKSRLEKIISHKKRNNMDKQFCHKLNEIGFTKIVHIHEIISHYTRVIIHSNNISIPIKTPPEPLINYSALEDYIGIFSRYDGGDKGESILLGNKSKYICPKASIFILDNNNYKKQLDLFRIEYLETNKIIKGEFLDLSKEEEKIKLIGFLYKEMKVEGIIRLTKKTVSNFRTMDYIEEKEDNNDEEEEEEEYNDSEDEDEYSNQWISCFNISIHIFPYFEKKKNY